MNRLLSVRDKLNVNTLARLFVHSRTQLDFVQNHASDDISLISTRIYWWTQRFYVVFLLSWFFILFVSSTSSIAVVYFFLLLFRNQVHHANKTRNKMVADYARCNPDECVCVKKQERINMRNIVCAYFFLSSSLDLSQFLYGSSVYFLTK